jgi:8-oxo-dGTP pyrophosphatase MutT (NUDIX family)
MAAVRAVLFDSDQRVLFLRRSPTSGGRRGQWCLVGGRIQPGESSEQALTREAMEETALHVRPRLKIETVGPQEYWLTDLLSSPDTLSLNHESDQFTWLPVSELRTLHPLMDFRTVIRIIGRVSKLR